MELETVLGQPSWRISSNRVEAFLTKSGGHLGPITFRLDGRDIQPLSVAPWHDEPLDPDLPPVIRGLRGDFFCMPFGANETEYRGERHPPHGETANGTWNVDTGRQTLSEPAGGARLVAEMGLSVRPGRVEKVIELPNDETVVYQSHRISGMAGPMSFGHHAMVKFPDREGAGLVSTSPFVYGSTAPLPVELPENRGYSILVPDRRFSSLSDVPTITGQSVDASRYPSRKGFEDLVMLVSTPQEEFAWSAVAFPSEGYVWFALKDPTVLRATVMWLSNRGRHYPPWSGRHECVLGIEEVTSYFHYGLAESVAPNPISEAGHPTCFTFEPDSGMEIRYVMGLASCPESFGKVASIESSGDREVSITDERGAAIRAQVDWRFVGGK